MRRPALIKLALYLPNFNDKVTVDELEDLRSLAEDRCAYLARFGGGRSRVFCAARYVRIAYHESESTMSALVTGPAGADLT